ncbi:MAG TPA: O-antigen ligase family protein [Candidatus Levybacteria bacterium]|nr:O-antigen ligase family protein [Candidatus Levybacteria bacterium]
MLLNRIDSWIRICFYFLFATLPLIMFPTTSELFELNKMWTVWGVSLIVLFLWLAKMLLTKKWIFQRTPLDIPIGLFLLSQLLSTIFSMDQSVSFWGYYSRFNGGFLSLLSYVFLYYAFASNVLNDNRRNTIKTISVAFGAGVVVALWGFPSHFGYDPTCLVFRGALDVSCWTEAFQPKVRIFSTLGQPNWLAAYLAVLIPICIAFLVNLLNTNNNSESQTKNSKKNLLHISLLVVISIIFYIDLTWTDSQSGFLGLWAGLVLFWSFLLFKYFTHKKATSTHKTAFITTSIVMGIFVLLSIFLGTPVDRLKQFSLNTLAPDKQETTVVQDQTQTAPALPALEFGGTDSSKIRLVVWEGALDVFRANPIFGSGVETFAYSYYAHRPIEHNLTSEWDYLYNKAHNEYLNYLATTGLFGLGTYLLFIGWVIFLAIKSFHLPFSRFLLRKSKTEKAELVDHQPSTCNTTLAFALFAGWISILVSNFFGFSVVITNLFLFILPLWTLHLVYPKFSVSESAHPDRMHHSPSINMAIVSFGIIIFVLEIVLLRYWTADKAYGMGNNLNKIGEYTTANQFLISAVQQRPREDLFKDELAVNVSTLALLLQQQNESTQAAQLAQQAKFLSDSVTQKHPNNVVYWKSRTRIMYSLAQIEPSLYPLAVQAIERASELAPTDAKVMYNKALLYEQGGQREQAMLILRETIRLKPNYRDALYAKALIHTEIADSITATNSAQAVQERAEARKDLELILNHIIPEDTQAQELLEKLP